MISVKAIRQGARGFRYKKCDRIGYLFTAPMVILYLLFTVIPLACTFYFSLCYYNMFKIRFLGLENYVEMFSQDPIFLQSIANTLVYMFWTIFPSITMGLILAIVLNGRVPGKVFFRAALYSTNLMSMTAISLAWLFIYDGNLGVLNALLKAFGMQGQNWLYNPDRAMGCIIVMSVWSSMGYNMVIYLSGLQGIPHTLYEAARIDGADAIQQFFYISLPLLKPTTFFLFVMGCISSFQVFDQIFMMTGGGPLNRTTTMVYRIYLEGFTNYRMGYASAQAMFLFALILGVTLLNFKFGDRSDHYDVT